MKARIRYGLLGLLYSAVFALWGMGASGGGHFNLGFVLAISPMGFGVLIWPVLATISADLKSKVLRLLFVGLMLAHYLGLISYFSIEGNRESELYWFRAGMHIPSFILSPLISSLLYLSGQVFFWRRFFRTSTL